MERIFAAALLLHFFAASTATNLTMGDICAMMDQSNTDSIADSSTLLVYVWNFCGFSKPFYPTTCPDNSTIMCVIGNNGTIKNAGRIDKLTVVNESADHVSATFSDGEACPHGSNYETRFDFFCPEDESLYGYQTMIPKTGDPCQFNFFMWVKFPGCPEENTDPGEAGCLLETGAPFGQKLDLAVFRSPAFYVAFSGDRSRKFHVNLCAGISGNAACPNGEAVCEIGADKAIIGARPITKSYFDKAPVLEYFTTNSSKKAVFRFVCDENADAVSVEFSGEIDESRLKTYEFTVKTSRVCLYEPSDCQLEDKQTGRHYDLTSLQSQEWVVYGTSGKDKEIDTIYVSVCKPVSPAVSGHNCPDPGTSVCRVSPNGTSTEIGNFRSVDAKVGFSELSRRRKKVVQLYYGSNTPCETAPGKNHSVSIHIRCAATSLRKYEPGPLFRSVDENCTHSFSWVTEAGCGLTDVHTSDCVVRDEFFGHAFDLNGLHDPGKDFHLNAYVLNVCGAMKSACGLSADKSAVCFDGHVVGRADTQTVELSDHSITMSYTGDKCDESPEEVSRAEIYLHCDHKAGRGRPEFVEKKRCLHEFVWSTALACPPYDEVDCTQVDDEGNLYDLSELILADSNYEVFVNEKEKFVFNVCKSIVYSPTTKCSYKSAVCHARRDSGNRTYFVNSGQVKDGPKFDHNGRLVIEYVTGGFCHSPDDKGLYMRTKIIFRCRENAESMPEFVEQIGCQSIFLWEHRAACPRKISSSEMEISGTNCTVRDSIYGHVYNLGPLVNKTENLQVTDPSGTVYYINVCAPLVQDSTYKLECGKKSGACMKNAKDEFLNIGDANSSVIVAADGENLELKYYVEGGKLATILRFFCAPLTAKKLVFAGKTNGVYAIDIYTSLACTFNIPCLATDPQTGHEFDFSPLVDFGRDFRTEGEKFAVSVCKPVNYNETAKCPPGSAICGRKDAISYGVPKDPMYVKNGDVYLDYVNGSPCGMDGTVYNSTIHFKCNPNVFPGAPKTVPSSNKCHLSFTWETAVACVNATLPTTYADTSSCKIFHPYLRDFVSLDGLRSSVNDVELATKTATFWLQPCGRAHHCSGTVCIKYAGARTTNSLGVLSASKYFETFDEILVRYDGGDRCEHMPGANFSTEIRFQCDQNAENSVPRLIGGVYCHPIFSWRTRHVCTGYRSYAKKALAAGSKPANSHWPFGILTIFGIVLVAGSVLVLRKPENRRKLRFLAYHWKMKFFRRANEDSILVDTSVNIPTFNSLDDDDDDLIIA